MNNISQFVCFYVVRNTYKLYQHCLVPVFFHSYHVVTMVTYILLATFYENRYSYQVILSEMEIFDSCLLFLFVYTVL